MMPGLKLGLGIVGSVAAALLGIAMLSNFEMPGRQITVQRGFRGVAMETNYNPVQLAKYVAENKVPASLPQLPATGPKAGQVYKNVLVLGELSVGQFTRLMVSITNWVSPKQGCAYCHNTNNMAEDTYYTKIVARRMLQMTQNINGNWKAHVANIGVTCYTCHAGNPVPKNIWFNDPGPPARGLAETQTGMAHPTQRINLSSLPYDPFTPFLEQSNNIRVQGETALAGMNKSSMKQTEWTYALMVMMSQSLGVNCDYCHNTRAFRDWSQSSPARVTAWYGIRMVRDLNNNYLDNLNGVFPAYRKGVTGDSPKVYCNTCHQGIYKPLFGVSMLTTFSYELGRPPATTAMLMAPYIPPPDDPAAAPAAPDATPPK